MPTIDTRTNNRPVENGQPDPDSLDQSSLPTDQVIRRGQDAWARVRGNHTWTDWLKIGAALGVGRAEVMYAALANKPVGRNYNIAFGAWLEKHGFDTINDGDRTRLFRVMDHLDQIENWRRGLPLNERLALNHPSSVLRRWKAAAASDPIAPKKPSPQATLKAVNVELQEKLYRAERELARGGGDLWSSEDRAESIANVMLDKLTPNKAERVARTILSKLKERKKAAQSKSAARDAAMSAEEGKALHSGTTG